MSLVSVITPVFEVEKYIERCARSLFAQTIDDEDVEFIFVNDATRDSSIDILRRVIDEFPGKRVEIINHPSNLGLPAARKTGIEAAHGDYIIHCDSDDWIEPDYCRKLYEAAISQNADIVVCGYSLSDGENYSQDDGYDDRLLTNPDRALGAAIALKSSPYVWNKMVKRSLYDAADVQFPRRFLAEDWALAVQLVMSAEKIAYIEDKLYNYFINPNSILRESSKQICLKRISDEEDNVRLIDDLLKQRNLHAEFKSELIKRKAVTKSMVFPCTSDLECRKVWRKTFREANLSILFNRYIDKQYKRKHLMLLTGLYAPLRYLYHIIKPIHNVS